MIILDTETTGLGIPSVAPLAQQPRVWEIAAFKVDDKTLKQTGTLTLAINPQCIIPPEVVKICHLDAKSLKSLESAPTFIEVYQEVADFFLGEKIMVAHNLPYDALMLYYELLRIEKQCAFPWPFEHICTVELTYHLKNKRQKLTDLYEHCTKKKLDQEHRGLADVEALYEVVKWCRKNKLL